MYLHIGNGVSIKDDSIIGIFDLDTATVSKITKKFINESEKRGEVEYTDYDLPRSFIVCGDRTESVVKLSRISSVGLKQRLEETEAALAEAEKKYAAIVLAHESISNAGENLRRNVTPRLRAAAGTLMRHLTDEKYYDFGIGEDFALSILTESGTKPISSLSAGTRDAAYFSLRTALSSMLFPADRPPMILDEVFAQLDDTRAAALLDLLEKIAEESQVIILTCHSREADILAKDSKEFAKIEI